MISFVLRFGGLLVVSAAVAAAHELDAQVQLAPPAVVIHAAYGGTEPVSFAKVEVFSPAMPSQAHQTGLTDKRGYFSFVPDTGGSWRVILDDEEGHRREISVPVPQPFESRGTTTASASSRLERALLGIALIIGATGFAYGFKARQVRSGIPS